MRPRREFESIVLVVALAGATGCAWYERPVGRMECPGIYVDGVLAGCPSNCTPVRATRVDPARQCQDGPLHLLFCRRGLGAPDASGCIARFGTGELYYTRPLVGLVSEEDVFGFVPCSDSRMAEVWAAAGRMCPAP